MQNCLLYFRCGLLETCRDDLIYYFRYFLLEVLKLHIFRRKISDTLGDAPWLNQLKVHARSEIKKKELEKKILEVGQWCNSFAGHEWCHTERYAHVCPIEFLSASVMKKTSRWWHLVSSWYFRIVISKHNVFLVNIGNSQQMYINALR